MDETVSGAVNGKQGVWQHIGGWMLTLRARQVLHPAHISLWGSQDGSAAKGEKTGRRTRS